MRPMKFQDVFVDVVLVKECRVPVVCDRDPPFSVELTMHFGGEALQKCMRRGSIKTEINLTRARVDSELFNLRMPGKDPLNAWTNFE